MTTGSRDPNALINRLLDSPLVYRHALGLLDPRYEVWRPEGEPACEVRFFDEAPVVVLEAERACQVLWEPSDEGVEALVGYLASREVNVLSVLGEGGYRALRPLLGEGRWTLSRNYGVTSSQLRPRPSDDVRKLGPSDCAMFEHACAESGTLQSPSIRRDFDWMVEGRPVTCFGAFAGQELVAFSSSNPICQGVTEISKVAVAEQHRRRGLASGLLTAQAQEAFARGDAVGYYSGSAGDDLDAMLVKLGFCELLPDYRFVPASSPEQWQAWGKRA